MPSRKRGGLRLSGGKDAAQTEAAEATDVADSVNEDSLVEEDTEDTEDTEDDAVDRDGSTGASATTKTRRSRRPLPRIRISLTALVAAVLVILVGLGSWLFLNRPVTQSPIELTAFDEILSAARSGIVDVTSFDYLTLDQDIAEIDAVTVGELHDDTIAALEDRREQLVTDQQVSATAVIAASVTEASATQATALVVLRARVKNLITPQETVTRYRVQVELRLVDGRWLLSNLTGA